VRKNSNQLLTCWFQSTERRRTLATQVTQSSRKTLELKLPESPDPCDRQKQGPLFAVWEAPGPDPFGPVAIAQDLKSLPPSAGTQRKVFAGETLHHFFSSLARLLSMPAFQPWHPNSGRISAFARPSPPLAEAR